MRCAFCSLGLGLDMPHFEIFFFRTRALRLLNLNLSEKTIFEVLFRHVLNRLLIFFTRSRKTQILTHIDYAKNKKCLLIKNTEL